MKNGMWQRRRAGISSAWINVRGSYLLILQRITCFQSCGFANFEIALYPVNQTVACHGPAGGMIMRLHAQQMNDGGQSGEKGVFRERGVGAAGEDHAGLKNAAVVVEIAQANLVQSLAESRLTGFFET